MECYMRNLILYLGAWKTLMFAMVSHKLYLLDCNKFPTKPRASQQNPRESDKSHVVRAGMAFGE
jgi:hypothetical protein